jgi:hypothetical protein
MGLRLGNPPNRKGVEQLPDEIEKRINILSKKFPNIDIDYITKISSCPIFKYTVDMPVFSYTNIYSGSIVGKNISTETNLVENIIDKFNNFLNESDIRNYCIYDIQYPYIRGAYLDINEVLLREAKINKILN